MVHRRRHRVLRRRRGGAREGAGLDRPGRPVRCPDLHRLDQLSVGDFLREIGATPGRAAALGAGPPEPRPTGRSSGRACSPTPARSPSAAAPAPTTSSEWENLRVAEGSATVALTMADGAARRTPLDAGLAGSRSAPHGCTVTTARGRGAPRRRRRARRTRPVRRATSTSPASATSGSTSLRRQRHAWAAKFVAAYDGPFWRDTRPERAVRERGRARLDLAAAGGRALGAGPAGAVRRLRGQRPGDPHPRGARPDRRAVRRPRPDAAADLDPPLGHRPVDAGLRHQLATRRRRGRRAAARHPRAAVLRLRLRPVGRRLHGGRRPHRPGARRHGRARRER